MRSTKADRPRKRQGNFGDNKRTSNQHTKTTMYRQMGQSNKNEKRQFSR
jgi:hypothetical protein